MNVQKNGELFINLSLNDNTQGHVMLNTAAMDRTEASGVPTERQRDPTVQTML